jgi:succinylglutamate desuccinylase
MNRIINTYSGEQSGILFFVFGAMHGNETAGVAAIKRVFELIDLEPQRNPNFRFFGKIVGLIGNLKAYEAGKRYVDKDLNRQWTSENIARISASAGLDAEDAEIFDILNVINAEIKSYRPEKLYILDLHTTSADGGVFTIPSADAESLKIALDMHAPVVQGMLDGLQGTTLHYFTAQNFDLPTTAVSFEAGQHESPEAVDNAVSAIINCLRAIGCVAQQNVDARHNNRLYQQSKGLPNLTRLIYREAVRYEDEFVMLPNFKNFQYVPENTLLAHNKHGEIRNKEDGYLLMPLYQKQGADGFFLVKKIF